MLSRSVQFGNTRPGVCLSSSHVGERSRPGLSPGHFYAPTPTEGLSVWVSLCRSFSHIPKTDRIIKSGRVKTSPAHRQPPKATVRGDEGAAYLQPKQAFTAAQPCFPSNAAVVDLLCRLASGSKCDGTRPNCRAWSKMPEPRFPGMDGERAEYQEQGT